MTCHNYKKMGIFSFEFTKPKRILSYLSHSNFFVTSAVLVAKSLYLWFLELGATNRVVKD